MEQSKPWSIGLAVRGFYDDNYTTSPKDLERDSWGISVSPWASVSKSWDQTFLGLSYTYDMRWYEDRESNEADHIQTAKLRLEHRFNERMDIKLHDSFYYGQEGTVELGPVTTPTGRPYSSTIQNGSGEPRRRAYQARCVASSIGRGSRESWRTSGALFQLHTSSTSDSSAGRRPNGVASCASAFTARAPS